MKEYMKITFKLNKEQTLKAIKLVKETSEGIKQSLIDVEISGSGWKLEECGNLHSIYISGYTNTNQWLQFDALNNTLTYVGERCPFEQDGSLKTVMKILAGDGNYRNYQDFTPIKYETSDPRMNWYETLYSYMRNRATLIERVGFKLKQTKKDSYEPCLTQLEREFGIRLSLNTKTMYAMYETKLANSLVALISMTPQYKAATC